MKIKTNDELVQALARFDDIWSARPGDPEWEERCALADAIEAYEEIILLVPTADDYRVAEQALVDCAVEHTRLRGSDVFAMISQMRNLMQHSEGVNGIREEGRYKDALPIMLSWADVIDKYLPAWRETWKKVE